MSDGAGKVPKGQKRKAWLLAGSIAVLIVLAVSFEQLRRHGNRQRLIAEIERAGGGVLLPDPVWVRLWKSRGQLRQFPVEGTVVALNGPAFDDAWLRAHDDLVGLRASDLHLSDTNISAAGLARLVEAQPISYLAVRPSDFSDVTARALTRHPQLKHLELYEVPLSDDVLTLLPPEELKILSLHGTTVTPAGLRHLQRCEQLYELTLDVAQLDQVTAANLQLIPQLIDLRLTGEDVTDEHARLLHGMTGLQSIYFEGTSVTEKARTELALANLGCAVGVE